MRNETRLRAKEWTVMNGMDRGAFPNILINSGRGVIYADGSPRGFASGARTAAMLLRDAINEIVAGYRRRLSQKLMMTGSD